MPVPSSITTASHKDLDLTLVAGEWPEDVTGEFVVSAPETRPGLPYALFGPGRICRLSLRPGTHGAAADRFAWRSRVVDSPSARLFEAAPEQFVAGPTGYNSPFGVPNQANTAPLPWGDRLFTTWDVGRPVEVDPRSLGFLGEVGHRDSWGEQTLDMGGVLPFFLSSAHPVVDPDRDALWTVKLGLDLASGAQMLHVVYWPGDGTEVKVWPVEGGAVFGGSHTITQTANFLLLADSGNFKTDMGEMAGEPRTVTVDDDAAAYILRKEAILATPPGTPLTPTVTRIAPTAGHFYGRWNDDDGISVIFEHMDRMDLGYRIQSGDLDANGKPVDPDLVGFYNTAMAPSTCSEVVFDPDNGASKVEAVLRDDWTWNLQLSAMDWSSEALRAPTLHHIAYQGFRPGAVSKRAVDNYGDRLDPLPTEDTPGMLVSVHRGSLDVSSRYEYSDTTDHITSPAFAPRDPAAASSQGDPARSSYAGSSPGGHDGYVILPVLSDSGMRVDLFDASRVGDGPVATLATPNAECVPVVLHSAWMPSTDGPAKDRERVSFADELAGHVETLPDELAALARGVAEELQESAG
ncbi:MAG: carotenoid oxygenase family protein [Microthrixaceae bacterium]|nr:carotenoid oxygenase family protein [Microthrixaceae bacterium]MCB1011746.1 carotenoid oxygenase family protein [Microthrixaceae bacterium]MCO5321089.1 carotenoid oxygenase family protein [Microthrixaceae bacterium]